MNHFRAQYLKDVHIRCKKLKDLADKAVAQVSHEHFFAVLHPEENSIAILMQHMSGNMRSRWTDFLHSDGEKPNRHRDTEFEIDSGISRAVILTKWETGWDTLFKTIASLHPSDLDTTVHIRGKPYTVLEAINRQLLHYAYHVGQIVMLAKHFASEEWVSLSIPRGKSEEYNKKVRQYT